MSIDVTEGYTDIFTKYAQKRVSKSVLFCDAGKSKDEYVMSWFVIIFIIASIGIDLYLIIKYNTSIIDPTINKFITDIFIVLCMFSFGLFLHKLIVNDKIKIETFSFYSVLSIFIGIMLGGIILLIEFAFNFQQLLYASISGTDYFMFFLTVAVAEEIFWRFGILPTIKTAINYKFYKKTEIDGIQTEIENKWANLFIISGISIIITTIGFTIYHIFVYTDTKNIIMIFVIGLMLGIGVETTQRIDTSIFAHILLNAIAGYSIVMQMFGGF